MSEYVIKEDSTKLLLYTIGDFALSLLLMILSVQFYMRGRYLLTFFSITGIWFSVKYMCRYGMRLVKKKTVCSFGAKEVTIHSLPGGDKTFLYRDVDEVKILSDWKSIKIFFSGKYVKHPSGWDYVGVIYPFKRKKLEEVEKQATEILEKHQVKVSKVTRK
ncbi:MAG: hypothetical protein HUJ77_10425 [Clostridium sp.]|uniref:hypothetical protein n=1 Tax=Clostridium sp. TaxID=1506 RepID=UPI0025C056A7|nr:hypothetical protein [Clostridium sp.]MCF0148795.1 hypothetical protein [Clostridium sp.]